MKNKKIFFSGAFKYSGNTAPFLHISKHGSTSSFLLPVAVTISHEASIFRKRSNDCCSWLSSCQAGDTNASSLAVLNKRKSQLEAGGKPCWWQLPLHHPHPHHHHLRPVRGQTSPGWQLTHLWALTRSLSSEDQKKAKCAVPCGFYFSSFFFFYQISGENAPFMVT